MHHLGRTIAIAALTLLALGCTDEAEVVDVDDPPAAATVVVQEFAFPEPSAVVAPGTPVTWENLDEAAHTVTSGTPGEPSGVFDAELPAEGQVTIAFEEPGTFPYYCRIHPNMTAEVVVEPALD